MDTMFVTFIQFTSGIDQTSGYGDVDRRSTYIVADMNDSNEFYDGEDDDGDEMHSELDCISVYDCIEDFKLGRYQYHVAKNSGLKYSTITIECEIDGDGYPILKTA